MYVPNDRVAQLCLPGTGFPFRRLLRLAGLGGGILTRPHMGIYLIKAYTMSGCWNGLYYFFGSLVSITLT
jgi:hypothetical protein